MVAVNWELSEKQVEHIFDKTKYLIVEGSAGSGKTLFAAHKVIMYALEYADARIGIFRQTLPSLKMTAWLEIRQLLDKYELPYKENKSEGVMTFPNGSTMTFKSLDDLRKIRSMNLDYVYVEQAEEIDKATFEELESRVRGKVSIKEYPQLLLVVQPELKSNWIYQRFHLHKDEENIKIIHFHYTENPFVGEDYIQLAKDRKKFDYENYLRMTLGRWGDVGDRIYEKYDFKQSDKGYEYYTGGIDYGFSNPACFLLVGWIENEPYVIDELYESHLTNNQLIGKVNHLLKKHGLNPSSLEALHCDAAEPDRIEEFCQYGFNALPSVKNVQEKINAVRAVTVHINEDNCPHTKDEIENYSYLKDKDGNPTDKPQKVHDHAMDALGYCIWGTVGILSPYGSSKDYVGFSFY